MRHTGSHQNLRFGLRGYCRRCGYRTGVLAKICYGCSTRWPGIRRRLLWQAPLVVVIIALVVYGAIVRA